MSRAPIVVHLLAADMPADRLPALIGLLESATVPWQQVLVALGEGPLPIPNGRKVERLHAPVPCDHVRRLILSRYLHRCGARNGLLILHAWSPLAGRWACELAATHRPLLVEVPPSGDSRLVARWAATRCVSLVCPSATVRAELIATGAPPTHCVVIRPPVDADRLSTRHRPTVRARLNLADRDSAILVLPPLARRTGALVAAWGAMLLEKVRPQTRLVIPADGRETERIRRLVAACRHEWMTRFAPPELELCDLLVGADLAIYLPSGSAPPTAPAWAAAARRPLVAADVPSITELFADGQTAWLCPALDPQQAARRLLHALEHPAQSRRLAEQAAAIADLFKPARALSQYALAYQRLATRRPVADV